MLGNLTVIYTFCRCLVGGVGSRALCISVHIDRTRYKGKHVTQLHPGHLRIGREARSIPSIASGLGISFQADEKWKVAQGALNIHTHTHWALDRTSEVGSTVRIFRPLLILHCSLSHPLHPGESYLLPLP